VPSTICCYCRRFARILRIDKERKTRTRRWQRWPRVCARFLLIIRRSPVRSNTTTKPNRFTRRMANCQAHNRRMRTDIPLGRQISTRRNVYVGMRRATKKKTRSQSRTVVRNCNTVELFMHLLVFWFVQHFGFNIKI